MGNINLNCSLAVSFFFFFFLFGCTKELSTKDFIQFIHLSEMTNKKVKEGDYLIQVTYLPSSYMALLESKNLDKKDLLQNYNLNKEHFENALYFKLEISLLDGGSVLTSNLESEEEYYSRIYYLNYQLQEDLFIRTSDKKVIRPILSSFQNTHGIKPSVSVLLAFPKSLYPSKAELIFNDKVFSKSSEIIYQFDFQKIDNNMPHLII